MNHKDYSFINNMDDLKKEIRLTKVRIHQNRERLEQRWHDMPTELEKKPGGSVMPLLFNGGIASNSWQLLRTGVNLLLSKRNVAQKKREMKNAAIKMGLYVLGTGLLIMLRKRK